MNHSQKIQIYKYLKKQLENTNKKEKRVKINNKTGYSKHNLYKYYLGKQNEKC